VSQKKTLRVFCTRHSDGRWTGLLMRWRERFFDIPPPSAYGDSWEEVLLQLESVMTERLARMGDELDRYLWGEHFETRQATVIIHPQTFRDKRMVIGAAEIPLRLTYAWAPLDGKASRPSPDGARKGDVTCNYRVMLPRFGWWFIVDSLSIAPEVLKNVISSALVGEKARWVYDFRPEGEETVREWSPRWLERAGEVAAAAADEAGDLPTVRSVADEWVERASRGKLPMPVGEPQPGFERLVDLARRDILPSILLVGPTGGGKTATIRRLARVLLDDKRAERRTRRLWATRAERILAGMVYLGMWQERCLTMANELSHEGDILYVDHLNAVLASHAEGSSILDLWRGPVESGAMSILAECTPEELERCRRREPRLIDGMELVQIAPLSPADVPTLIDLYQSRRGAVVRLHPTGAKRVTEHLDAFERSAAFPGKAVRFVDWLVEEGRGQTARTLYGPDASNTYARYSGLPLGLIAAEKPTPPSQIEAELGARVIGQRTAVAAAARVLVRFQAGLNDPERPVGSLFFVGPTGVGKTELARQLARYMFGDAERMVRVDMSEYMLGGSAGRLLATGLGGESLADRVRQRPLCLVLFDEIEKAHPEVFDLLLGVLGEGRLTDELGRLVDFRGALIVMTSNLGAGAAASPGFDALADSGVSPSLTAVRRHFRPELWNRIDAVVPFSALGPDELMRIVDLELAKIAERTGLLRRGLRLDVKSGAKDLVARLGHSPAHGARPLKRVVEELIVAPLAVRLAREPGLRDRALSIDAQGDQLTIDS
jgi:ATP-dependent Clp protease ATP-binding subunit ClpC